MRPARKTLLLTLLAAMALSALTALGNTTPAPFESEIRAFETADAASPPPRDVVLFVGSSTFAQWTGLAADFPGFTVLNRGFGGSQFGDVLHFFDRVVAAYQPALIVVYEGDNDLAGGRTVTQVFADWTDFVDRVARQLPDAGVLFVSVKPSPSRRAHLEAQQALNGRIAEDCATRPGCGFVDVATPMLDARGEPLPELFLQDQLHMNAQGYARWRAVLAPELEAWAAAHPERSIRTPVGRVLLDFGSADLTSAEAGSPSGVTHWNNLTSTVGASPQGRLPNLVTADGTPTTHAWVMTSRFNGVNQNGTTTTTPFPTSATRDSMFGNTESFSGLANVTPAFRLTGLPLGVPHDLTFYASRTGVSDRRETRYTVTGASSAFADLDAANNVAGTARVLGMHPDGNGELAVALSPGPRNNNANHFVYLGLMVLEEAVPGGRVFFVDVGGTDSLSGPATARPTLRWNDVPTSVGTNSSGVLANLMTTDGRSTGIGLQMITGFRAEDLTGTSASTVFQPSATRDSLWGHAEPWEGREPATPAFRVTGLESNHVYSLGFYASSSNSHPGRETLYQVAGAVPPDREALLDTAANTNRVAWVTGVAPDSAGSVQIRLLPGPANEGAGHIIHLGVLTLEWRPLELPPPPTVEILGAGPDGVRLHIRTAKGRACQIERSLDLVSWEKDRTVRPGAGGIELGWETRERTTFFRLLDGGTPQ